MEHLVKVGFIGAGGIAKAHAYSLSALKYYYNNTLGIEFRSVTSAHNESRVSSVSGDLMQFEIYAENGSLRYSSAHPDCFEYYLENPGQWVKQVVGSNYRPITSFPSGHVSPGWLRAMVHAQYIFRAGDSRGSVVPDLKHGLASSGWSGKPQIN
jgi:predicted dehydrogenase